MKSEGVIEERKSKSKAKIIMAMKHSNNQNNGVTWQRNGIVAA